MRRRRLVGCVARMQLCPVISRRRYGGLVLTGLFACHSLESGRVDSASLRHGLAGPILRATILGDSGDSRTTAAREALDHWNREFRRLGRHIQFDSVTVLADSIADDVVRAAQGEAVLGGGPATNRLLARLSDTPGDVVIVLTHADLISFSVQWSRGRKGVVAVRRADIWPLSLPNTARNVIAHEVGHVLGLAHNTDSTTLMCGRPAACRPAAFVSDTPRFFPLTSDDERRIASRWP